MIPVLIAPAYNRHDLLERMLASIDHPVGRTLIVDNGKSLILPLGSRFDQTLIRLGNVTRFQPPYTSIGYGGAINLGITQTPEEPWWLWVSNDVEFLPDTLSQVVEQMDQAKGPRVVTGGFTWGAVNQAAISKVGLIDDWNFFPIYFDDNDYQYRCKLAGVDWIEWWNKGSRHGDDEHDASATIRSDPALLKANHGSFLINQERYVEKWGGMPREERFTTPYGRDLPLDFVRPDLLGRARRVW